MKLSVEFDGTLTKDKAPIIWRDRTEFKPEQYEIYFNLICSFELAYWIEERHLLLVPSALPENKKIVDMLDHIKDYYIRSRVIVFQNFFPFGLFQRSMIAVLIKCVPFQDYNMSKNDMILSMPGGKTVKLKRAGLELLLQVRSKADRKWVDKKLEELTGAIESIIFKSYEGTNTCYSQKFSKLHEEVHHLCLWGQASLNILNGCWTLLTIGRNNVQFHQRDVICSAFTRLLNSK